MHEAHFARLHHYRIPGVVLTNSGLYLWYCAHYGRRLRELKAHPFIAPIRRDLFHKGTKRELKRFFYVVTC